MLFAYIDSQGKEVPIASADALRLRIELGAIMDETEFYDAGTDRWAPAREHEIYRTFRRELADGGEPAPPPAAEPSVGGGGEMFAEIIGDMDEVDESEGGPDEAEEDLDLLLEGGFDAVFDSDEIDSLGEMEPPDAESPEVEFPEVEGPEEVESWHESDPFEEGPGAGTFEAGPAADEFVPRDLSEPGSPDEPGGESAEPGAEPEESEEEPEEPFDFGGLGTIEVEEVAETEPEELPDVTWGRATAETVESDDDEPDWEMSGDLAGEDDSDAGEDMEGGPGADVFEQDPVRKKPAGDRTEAPRAAGPGQGESPRRGPAPTAGAAAAGGSRGSRPGPPRRKLTPKGSFDIGRAVTLILAVGALGAAGWFGLELLGAEGAESPRVASDVVTLPDLPTPLQPQLRQLAQRASTRMVDGFEFLSSRVTLAEGPGNEWLTGVYLANASDHMDVVNYWRNFGTLLSDMRASEADLFEAAYRDEVSAANLDPDDAEMLIERGIAGFEAAAPDRAVVYDQLQGVIDASIDLHQFLMENETSIDFEPAVGGTSRDPVLEAVPLTESLREEMMSRMVQITDALDALGYLNVVATEPLLDIVGEKLVATGIR